MQLTATPQRPALTGMPRSIHEQGSRLDSALSALRADLVKRSPTGGPNPIPTAAAAEQAIAALEALRPAIAQVDGAVRATFLAGGTHNEWLLADDVTSAAHQLTWLGAADARFAAHLRTAVASQDPKAWTDAQTTLTATVLAARDVANLPHRANANRYTDTTAQWAEQLIQERDTAHGTGNGDGQLDIDRESRTDGSRRYGARVDARALLVAADAAGDRNGVVTKLELESLGRSFDADRDSWLSMHDHARLQERYPTESKFDPAS